jgi:isoprenylcysteine carboxyl methyltransferase (ICMT) family protein YpbQ
LSILLALHNLKTFDNNKLNYKGNWYNQFIYVDTGHNWSDAEDFRERLKNGKSFFNALPAYEKYFLPTITVGLYYYFIDKEIFEIKSNGQKVIKTGNYKFGYLFIQIIFFYLSILYFSQQLKKKVNKLLFKLIIIFLCFEPSMIQWHSSMWTESIFLSFLMLLFSLILTKTKNYFFNILIGIVVGLLFAQRVVSFLYIAPVLIYFFFLRLKFKNYLFLFFGYLFIVFFIQSVQPAVY